MWDTQMVKQLKSTVTHRKKSISRLHKVAVVATCKSQRLREEEQSHWVDIIEAEVESSGTIRKLKLDIKEEQMWATLLEWSC